MEIFKYTLLLLFSRRSGYGTSVRASGAVDAGGSVDNVFAVALGNCVYRTTVRASAAADAVIGNFVCHWKTPPKLVLEICAKSLALSFPNTILSYFSKKAIHK